MITKMTVEEMTSMKLIPNRVLVKTVEMQDGIILEGGLKMHIDKQFSEEKHASVTGIVINLPETIHADLMPWETKMELKIGDYVVYSFESSMYCSDPNGGRIIHDENDEKYLMIDYEDVFVAKRGEEIIPVNGYMLVEPFTEQAISELELPVTESGRYGKVAFVGTRNTKYIAAGKDRTDVYDIKEEVNPGDIVLFSIHSDVPLEYSIHNTINDRKKYFRMQRRDILSLISPESISNVKISLVN